MEAVLDFLNEYWRLIAGCIWLVMALSNKTKREASLDWLADVLSKPEVQMRIGSSRRATIYTKGDLKKIAPEVKKVLINPIKQKIDEGRDWKRRSWNSLSNNPDKPLKKFGYAFLLILFLLFLWADTIAIVNTLETANLISQIPEWLVPIVSMYELAVTFGTIITLIVVAIIASDLFGKGFFTDWDEETGGWRTIAKFILPIISVLAVAIIVGLGLQRLDALSQFTPEAHTAIQFYFRVVIFGFVPFNTVASTILIHREAIKGLQVFFLLFVETIFLFLELWYYIVSIFGAFGAVGIEIFIRLIFIIVVIVAFLLIPLDMILSIGSRSPRTNVSDVGPIPTPPK